MTNNKQAASASHVVRFFVMEICHPRAGISRASRLPNE
nr:E63 [uncultured bacterium]